MKPLLVIVSALTLACASAAPESDAPATPVPARSATAGLSVYEGTYAVQLPNRVVDLRVWVDDEGRLNGELVQLGQRSTFRPGAGHRFVHETMQNAWLEFTVENGRATRVTMHQNGREASGPRK